MWLTLPGHSGQIAPAMPVARLRCSSCGELRPGLRRGTEGFMAGGFLCRDCRFIARVSR